MDDETVKQAMDILQKLGDDMAYIREQTQRAVEADNETLSGQDSNS